MPLDPSESFAFALTSAAVTALVALHVGQSKPFDLLGKRSYMVQVNVSGYGNALSIALSDPIPGLYTDNASAPLDVHAGLRQVYGFGIYSHCAYVNKTAKKCTGVTTGYKFQPYKAITNDMPSNYSDYADTIIQNTAFANSSSLGKSSRSTYYLLLFGLIFSIISALMTTSAPIISLPTAFVASTLVFAASVIWTVLIKRVEHINSLTVQPNHVPLGIHVSAGLGLRIVWLAFAFLAASIMPHLFNLANGVD